MRKIIGVLAVASLLSVGLVGPAGAQTTCEPFSDICDDVHENTIRAITGLNIASGFPDGTYRPGANVTRGQMATFLTNALDLTAGDVPAEDIFDDVPSNYSHAEAISALHASGITLGFPDGTYRPGESVTRGQMASFLATGFDLSPSDVVRFKDIGGTHLRNINALATAGIAGGYSDDTYRPANPVTRGQMATFLARGLDLVARITPPPAYVAPVIVKPIVQPSLGSYSSVAAYEADVFDSLDSILGTDYEYGMLDDLIYVHDMWWYYEISDAQLREYLYVWIEVLDTHIDHFATKTPPDAHKGSFGHFTKGMNEFRVGATRLASCLDCDAAWSAFEQGLNTWTTMFTAWERELQSSFSTASVTEDNEDLSAELDEYLSNRGERGEPTFTDAEVPECETLSRDKNNTLCTQ